MKFELGDVLMLKKEYMNGHVDDSHGPFMVVNNDKVIYVIDMKQNRYEGGRYYKRYRNV